MTEQKEMRLSLAAKKLNVGIVAIVEKLAARGHRIENNPNAKLNYEHLKILAIEYNNNSLLEYGGSPKPVEEVKTTSAGNSEILYFRQQAKVEDKKEVEPTKPAEPEVIRAEGKSQGLTILGKIDLSNQDNSSKKVLQSKQEEILVKLNIEKDKSYRAAIEKIQKYKKTGQGDTLNLSDLDLYSIPKELIQLTKLKKIQLNNNNISEIENLPSNINEIELNNNLILKINNIPSKVTILRINHNRLSTIDKLPNSIQVLEADDNQILKTLQLPLSLKKIKLNNNQIKEIEFPPHVESIAVCNNQIDNLIPIESYKRLSELYLYGNQIKGIRPEIFGEQENYNCLKGLKNYLIELERKTEINRNVKILLVGNSGVGKSSILRALKGLAFDEKIKSTHAVSLDNLEFGDEENPVKFQVWDLGGQEIYYGTHRVFMMSPSIQLVIFDSETESISKSPDRLKIDEKVRNINLPFYVSRIEELSPDSKMIIVQNKFESMSEFPHRLKYLFEKYPVIRVRALDNKNIRILAAQIWEEAINLNIYGIEVPYYWERVREYCENILNRPINLIERTITKERFREICISEKVLLEGIDDLLKYLHDTGVVYHKEDLGNTIIIDQMWALKAIYRVFDRESKFYVEMREHSNGKCSVRTLFQDFDDLEETYSIDEKWMFLMYMKSCGMCFPIKPNPKERDNLDTFYVFPEFLPDQKTDFV